MKNSMKVLFLNQAFYPDTVATAQHLCDLALYLQRQGCEVTVVAGKRNYERREIVYAARENYRGIDIHRVGSTGFGKKSFWRRIVDSVSFDIMLMWKLLFIPKQDVIVAFTSPPLISIFGVLFKWLKGGKLCQWMMDINPEAAIAVGYLKEDSPVTKALMAIYRRVLLCADQVVVLDRWMKKKVAAHGFPEENIVVIPPWPVTEIKRPEQSGSAEKNPFRKANHLQGKFIVLFSGNHSIVHPLTTVLEAATLLRDRKDIQFVFVGAGLRVDEVTAHKAKYQLDNILQLPYQPREMLKASLAMANVHLVVLGEKVNGLVHTSKIYSILATGAPYIAVAPRESHLGDTLAECPYGFLVEHGHPMDMVKAIEKAQALTSEDLARFEKHNVDYVINGYQPEICLRKFYVEVVGGPAARIEELPMKATAGR